MKSWLNLVIFFLLFNSYIVLSEKKDDNKDNKDNKDNTSSNNNAKEKNIKTMKPRVLSQKYDENTVALDFSISCLGDTDPEEVLMEILNIFPCLTITNIYKNRAFRQHGDVSRVYLTGDNDNGTLCLETEEIDWNEYCVIDVTYDLILELNGLCNTQKTNSIYYSGIKKPNAWALDMTEGTTDNNYNYPNISTTGDHNVDIWILDSGIYASHKEFYPGQIIDEDTSFTYSNAHGTGTASCAGGINYGTSKKFQIHDYPVCRDTLCAFQYIDIGLHKVIDYMNLKKKRSVINMSLGSSGASLLSYAGSYFDNLFQSVLNAGGIIVVASGNENVDACNYWFSYSDKVISVGAVDVNKVRSSFSNYGNCVDIYAPGSSIPTAYSTNDINSISYVSGTSFSSPLVAGMVANILYEDNTRTKDQILQILKSNTYPVSNCPSGYCRGTYYKCLY